MGDTTTDGVTPDLTAHDGPPRCRRRPPATMALHVGPWAYTVRVSRTPIVFEGGECNGIATLDGREILLARHLSPERRLEVLLHEAYHAWAFHFRSDAGTEDQAQRFATMAASAVRDIVAAGGIGTLLALRPTVPSWKGAT